jgi:hypothetical protein
MGKPPHVTEPDAPIGAPSAPLTPAWVCPVTSMWSRENARFPGINWGAERGVKDGVAAPFAIRGNADHRIDRYAIRATQTLTGPRLGNYARFINTTTARLVAQFPPRFSAHTHSLSAHPRSVGCNGRNVP